MPDMKSPPAPAGKPKKYGRVLTGEKATGIPVLDVFAYGRWPHLFTILSKRYEVPHDFEVTLLHLWDATMGSKDAPEGDLAVAQIPVRERESRKWLAAICSAGLFDRFPAPAGSKQGDGFYYNQESTPEDWEKVFWYAGWLKHIRGWDKVSPERFGDMFARLMGRPVSEAGQRRFREAQETLAKAAAAQANGIRHRGFNQR